jgi:hypothetical protein
MLISVFALAIFASAAKSDTPTYAKEVSRIVQKNCEGCHRPGQIGPFALTNYDEVRAFATEIKRVTQARAMPPWSAVPGHGEFKNERRLTDAEIATLAAWVDGGTPLGNRKDLPPAVKYNDDWALGKPDLVYTPAESFELAGNGVDEYRCFVIPSGLADTRYIKAMEVRPGNRKIVHHVRVFADITGRAREADAADPKPGFDCSLGMTTAYKRIAIGGWAPGMTPEPLPDDIGVFFPRGSDVVMEVHYHRNGLRESDRSSLGVYLHAHTPKNVQKSLIAVNLGIRIPPGVARHQEKARLTVNRDVLAISVMPHMHLLGTEMRVVATFPDGRTQDLVWAKPYDFNWQTTYRFREPVAMPKGTRIDVTAYYDNSESNPKNPNNPLKEIRWGEGTTEEMLVAFIGVIDAPAPPPAASQSTSSQGN